MQRKTLTDLIDYEIKPALDDWFDDYDIESIVNEAYEYTYLDGYKQREDIDFWEVVSKHDISNGVNRRF